MELLKKGWSWTRGTLLDTRDGPGHEGCSWTRGLLPDTKLLVGAPGVSPTERSVSDSNPSTLLRFLAAPAWPRSPRGPLVALPGAEQAAAPRGVIEAARRAYGQAGLPAAAPAGSWVLGAAGGDRPRPPVWLLPLSGCSPCPGGLQMAPLGEGCAPGSRCWLGAAAGGSGFLLGTAPSASPPAPPGRCWPPRLPAGLLCPLLLPGASSAAGFGVPGMGLGRMGPCQRPAGKGSPVSHQKTLCK